MTSQLPHAIDQLIATAIAWRHADESDDEHETDLLVLAVDIYESTIEDEWGAS